jgi:acetyltransferase-like isoleucine patch superfamily enzyme
MRSGVPFILSEPISACVALVGGLLGREITGARARARGWLMSPFGNRGVSVGPRVDLVGKKNIVLDERVSLFGNTYLNATGQNGFIRIGPKTHVDQFCVLYGQGGLTIGANCAIASGVIIYTQTNQYAYDEALNIIDQPVLYKPVTIGDDVWIGAAAVILPGVDIGNHAVIGAGAVVRENVSPWSIVGGVPARVLGQRSNAHKDPSLRSVSHT